MSATEAEERAQFTLAMRARGINDLGLLRALERAPRALFMPQRFADISGRDIALPIGCGQTSPPPSIVAAMIAALDLKPSHQRLRNRNRNRLLRGVARPTCEHDRLARAVPDAGGRGVGADQGLRARQCRGRGGRTDLTFTARANASIGSSSMASSSRRARRFAISSCAGGVLVAAVAGPERGEQRIVRLAGDLNGARRGRRLRSGARRAAARARPRARLVDATRQFDAPDFDR